MCGEKSVPNRDGVQSAGKRKMRRSRVVDEDTQRWEAAFREFMEDEEDDDDYIEPFLTGAMAQSCKLDGSPPADTERGPKRCRVSPSHPYRGIRQRPWGRWSAEIRDTKKGTRVWIGTFDTAECAAHAYDAEARRIHGTKARTNFPVNTVACCCLPSEPSAHSTAEVSNASTSRIVLECCSDDVMESLFACSDNNESGEHHEDFLLV